MYVQSRIKLISCCAAKHLSIYILQCRTKVNRSIFPKWWRNNEQ